MFLHVSVILSTREGCLVRGGAWSRGVSAPGGAWSLGGVCSWGGLPSGDPPRTATAAGGTHPTGMHSCLVLHQLGHF